MSLIKWEPINSFNLFDDMDSVVRGLWRNRRNYGSADQPLTPRVDVMEKEDNYELRFELPGVDKNDIEISVNDGVLTVSGEKKAEEFAENDCCYMNERRYGKFSRSFRLADHVDEDKINAKFSDGILTLVLKKSEQSVSKSKTIKVE